MGALTAAMAKTLGDAVRCSEGAHTINRGASVWTVQTADNFYRSERLVVATDLGAARRLLGAIRPELCAVLAQIPTQTLQIVHLGLERQHLPEAFGFLVHPDEGGDVLGMLFSSRLAPLSAPPGDALLTCIVQACNDPIAAAITAAQRYLGQPLQPILTHCARFVDRIPIYGPGHRAVSVAVADASNDGLALAGNYFAGISVDAALRSGRSAGAALLQSDREKQVA
jgi:oxygen-dependent protoporphyrinogen oxidase